MQVFELFVKIGLDARYLDFHPSKGLSSCEPGQPPWQTCRQPNDARPVRIALAFTASNAGPADAWTRLQRQAT